MLHIAPRAIHACQSADTKDDDRWRSEVCTLGRVPEEVMTVSQESSRVQLAPSPVVEYGKNWPPILCQPAPSLI